MAFALKNKTRHVIGIGLDKLCIGILVSLGIKEKIIKIQNKFLVVDVICLKNTQNGKSILK